MLQIEDNGDITYKGAVVARRIDEGDHYRVELCLTYRAPKDRGTDWIVPLSWFGHGLRLIEPPEIPATLTIETPEEEVNAVRTRSQGKFSTQRRRCT
jgi:hypothetical protein